MQNFSLRKTITNKFVFGVIEAKMFLLHTSLMQKFVTSKLNHPSKKFAEQNMLEKK